jgi:ribosome-associated translation inhibitor RaiA
MRQFPYWLACNFVFPKSQTLSENFMKIQFNTDANIQGTEALAAQVIATVEAALEHFKQHITRVEIHLSDESRGKSGQHDQRCMLEARLEGRKPVAVTDHAVTLELAVDGAAEKLARLLDSTLGRLHDRREKTSGLPLSETEPE